MKYSPSEESPKLLLFPLQNTKWGNKGHLPLKSVHPTPCADYPASLSLVQNVWVNRITGRRSVFFRKKGSFSYLRPSERRGDETHRLVSWSTPSTHTQKPCRVWETGNSCQCAKRRTHTDGFSLTLDGFIKEGLNTERCCVPAAKPDHGMIKTLHLHFKSTLGNDNIGHTFTMFFFLSN